MKTRRARTTLQLSNTILFVALPTTFQMLRNPSTPSYLIVVHRFISHSIYFFSGSTSDRPSIPLSLHLHTPTGKHNHLVDLVSWPLATGSTLNVSLQSCTSD